MVEALVLIVSEDADTNVAHEAEFIVNYNSTNVSIVTCNKFRFSGYTIVIVLTNNQLQAASNKDI